MWKELRTARRGSVRRSATDLINFEDVRVNQPTDEASTVEEAARDEERTDVAALVKERDDAMRELMFLRQEREDWKREQQLLRKGLAILRNSLAMTRATGDNRNNSMSGGVRELKELLPEFNGTNDTFWKWREQLLLLKQTYQLSESSTRILISSRLKRRALIWFNSRPEYLILNVEELLKEMEEMFDLLSRKLVMRRQFESRIWNKGESFYDYYHDKMIFASFLPIAEDDIIDYLINGMMNHELQTLARLMDFHTDTELLWFFENDQLEYNRSSEVRTRKDAMKTVDSGEQEIPLARTRPAKCYRCHETEHVEYMIPVRIAIENLNRESCKYVIEALVDLESPVSLVRSDAILVESQLFINENIPILFGINGSRLRIDGAFYGILEISGVRINMKFYAVPSETVSYNVLLGRDFLNCPQLCFILGETFEVMLRRD